MNRIPYASPSTPDPFGIALPDLWTAWSPPPTLREAKSHLCFTDLEVQPWTVP